MPVEILFTCEKIAELVEGKIKGEAKAEITALNRIEYAGKGELTFLANPKFEKYLKTTEATCILVPETIQDSPKENMCFIVVSNPYHAFVKIIKLVDSMKPGKSGGIHPTAIIGKNTKIPGSVYIGPYCIIGNNCIIGENVVLHSRVTIYDDVKIGDNCEFKTGVVCFDNTVIGNNCIIHAGAVIGDDGFGYEEHKDGSYEKIPQIGNVVIKDNVEIGSNTTIDRAMTGSTIIESGVIIDNLVQIGHNVFVGENTAMAAQVGIAGSCKIGKRNRFGGQVGLAGHLDTVDDVILIAQSGVAKSINEKGIYFGAPIRERLKAFKIESAITDLPELAKEFRKLKKFILEKFNINDLGD
ncbi:MAG: UDP-3-O-(3-hydroxymyristoyl)glucosamine N-acyltransferase [FCB group bacterium]|jgi:UDP-3-O-[3-hydroxymyristoyl] glucosamine N-acyltransferase